ncbi:L,D-transpeptidase [Companilactobacillus halodurans]|uniref:L,D-transpeptidase n=1 Tax=Companilactobacillus halodurans TaxID=2584183 RepID=A0A5P0ZZL2_9LACO|nr:L,D-transpeptidase [Companilactobacillus halodurans]MQS75205.1 L,D-transpeptidase [Companilactobacillus halodurans]MQS98533.1 L,D-transpeptidase [Companilactobacillus halodurans]
MNLRGKRKKIIIAALVSIVCLLGIGLFLGNKHIGDDQINVSAEKKVDQKKPEVTSKVKVIETPETVQDEKSMVSLEDFKYDQASEKKDYPDLTKHSNIWIDVNIATQRTYIMDGKEKLYTMYASTGKNDTTPRGTYHIQNERGHYFYTAPLKLGAYYYVSFLNHGEYLFHTTPTNDKGEYVKSIAKTLGKEPSSHGCVHLSVPDCKWIFDNIPSGTKVVIHGEFQDK